MSVFDKPVCPAPPILHLPDVSKASGVRVPGAVDGAHGVDLGPPWARERALLAQVSLGTVAGDAGAVTGDLLVLAGLVFDAAGHVGPRAVLLRNWKFSS